MELSIVKRLTDALGKSFSKTKLAAWRVENRHASSFSHSGSQSEISLESNLTWLIACLTSLSKRGLIPGNLLGEPIEAAIARISLDLFGLSSPEKDKCDMAIAAGNLIMDLASDLHQDQLDCAVTCLQKVIDGPDGPSNRAALADPLMPGWVFQYLIHQSEKELKKSAPTNGHSPFYTKWFTPLWIADFLVEEAITDGGRTFVDPACGAGHILVPALKRIVELLIASGASKQEALQEAISTRLYGLEIDPQLSAAANFSLYLACRDMDLKVPLSVANVFTIVESNKAHLAEKQNSQLSVPTWNASIGGSLRLNSTALAESTFLLPVDKEDLLPLTKIPQKFGALAANPPYMSMRNMPKDLAVFLKEHYVLSSYDLYSAFVELSLDLLEDGSKGSLICQQSVLSISRYKPLRKLIEQESKIETLVQLGPGSFPTRPGEKVNNAIITLRRSSKISTKSDSTTLKYARILYPEEKKRAEISGIKSILKVRDNHIENSSSDSKALLAPWCPAYIMELFDNHPPLQNSHGDIVVVNGLFTCNNKMFVKKFDEVPEDRRHEYVPYDKGGGKKWYHSTPYLLHWVKDGDVIRDYRASRGQSRSLPGEDFYFKPGITYSYIGTQGFKARLLSPESIFDIASSSVFTPEYLRMYMLGFMNSSLVRFLLGVLNPTINFQIGDLRRLPFAQPDTTTQLEVSRLAEEAVNLAREAERLGSEKLKHASRSSKDSTTSKISESSEYLLWAREIENIIQKDIDRLIFALYEVPAEIQKQILQDPWVVRGQKDVFANAQGGSKKGRL
ncbi:MAG: hypothetical protein IT342_02750 [Candidatus Melainabacteria bacterium]|nr:hypothetical protein [Candidatus Melainabacteria bacterium]